MVEWGGSVKVNIESRAFGRPVRIDQSFRDKTCDNGECLTACIAISIL